ncbi:MAG: hypothetical protein JMN27_12035 [gamma proteobacterium endosymbiont of Lamellibrachia anaximandri]|nr:hypothetical protein [gamma proteobacterium endosymbiont of Lamellibrachia anaximandri]MBL3534550.1 hypothetical protein [gamma proteobacterium endosymbiont of Lamellibrachia anaximandri]
MLSLLLSLSLLCSQGATLHVHNLDLSHDDDAYLDHSNATDAASDHSHLSKAHYVHDTSHHGHHDGVVAEFDASSDGALKNLFNNILALALFALLFTLLLPALSRRVVQHHRESTPSLHGRYLLSPPLRAPPQHF